MEYTTTVEHIIEFTVVPGDIRSFDADVVVLKHAQAFFGADEAVAHALSRVGVTRGELRSKPGGYRYLDTRGGIRAHHVLFVGVPSLLKFGYQQIGEFATNALSILESEARTTRHVAMTIHGARYGLDEVEVFLSQFDGCFRAIQMGAVPSDLERISIVERSDDRVQRLRLALEQKLADVDYARRVEVGWAYRLIRRMRRMGHAGAIISPPDVLELQLPGARAEAMPRAFVAMPFKREMDDVFYYGIQGPVRAAGFLCERIDQEAFTGDILGQLKKKIEGAAVVIADLSDANPNVYLEIGYAWGKGRPTILLVKNAEELRFDVRGQRCLIYERIRDLEESLTRELRELRSKGLI